MDNNLFKFKKGPFINMSPVSELISYAHTVASNMGLQKPLDIKVNSKLGFNYYINTKSMRRIRLVNSNESYLVHELGHAYISEKLPRLYGIFDNAIRPLNILAKRYGEFGELVSNMLYSIALVAYFLYGALLIYKNGSLMIMLPIIIIGFVLIIPIIDEILATYFGEKFKLNNESTR